MNGLSETNTIGYYLCPLPQGQLAEGELETALTALEQGEVALSPVYRESPGGESEQIAEGYERQVAMSFEANGDSQSWTERRLVVRSLRHAKAAEASLRTRVAKAQTQVEALNQRGRGRNALKRLTSAPSGDVYCPTPSSRRLLMAALR